VPPHVVELGYGVRIEGVTFGREPSPYEPGSDWLHVTIYSSAAASTNIDLAVRCTVQVRGAANESDNYVSPYKPIGQGIWPISRWETNKFYRDDFLVPLPKGVSGDIAGVGFEAAPLSP
jgi:hypothetical protein